MTHTLTDETRRRLALGLVSRPVARNRRRRHSYKFNIAACAVCAVILAVAMLIAKL